MLNWRNTGPLDCRNIDKRCAGSSGKRNDWEIGIHPAGSPYLCVSQTPNRSMAKYRATVNVASAMSAANIRSVCARPFASNIRCPSPVDAPTHSPMTEPIGAATAASRRPEASEGRA